MTFISGEVLIPDPSLCVCSQDLTRNQTFSSCWPQPLRVQILLRSTLPKRFLFLWCFRDVAQRWADSLSQRRCDVTTGLWHQECSCQRVWELSVCVSHPEQKDDSGLCVEHWSAPGKQRSVMRERVQDFYGYMMKRHSQHCCYNSLISIFVTNSL